MTTLLVHASCVAFGTKGVLVRGKSGSGKSDLVLRLIDAAGFGLGETPLRAKLVADDQVVLTRVGDFVHASPPPTLAGKLEIRGQGIVDIVWTENVALCLVIDLAPLSEIPRMPEPHDLATSLLGIEVPRLVLDPASDSAPTRVRSFLV
jgi:HPr kinase/phosphorylase